MARVIGIDIVGAQLLAVELTGNDRAPAANALMSATLPAELTPERAEELGDWLRDQLATVGISAGDAVCTLGRNFVTFKSAPLPIAPDEELPAMAAFAAEGQWSATGEGVLDFHAGPIREEQLIVSLAFVGAPLVGAIVAMCKKAGLNLKQLSFRPYASHHALRATLPGFAEGTHLLIVAGAGAAEISLWSNDYLELCRTVPIDAEDEVVTRLVGEVRRTLASFYATGSETPIDAIVLGGQMPAGLAGELQEAVGAEILTMDMAPRIAAPAGFDRATSFVPMAAAWRELAHSPWPISFLKPKKPAPPRSPKRRLGVLAGALAALVVAAGYGIVRWQIAQRDAQVALLADKLATMNQDLGRYRPLLKRHHAIEEWVGGANPWLSEWRDLTASMPDTTDAFLTSVDFVASAGEKGGTAKLQGRAREPRVVTQLQTQWARDDHNHYRVLPRDMNAAKDAPPFDWRFDVELHVRPLETKVYKERAAAKESTAQKTPPEGMRRAAVSLAKASAGGAPPVVAAAPPPSPGAPPGGRSRAERKEDRANQTEDVGGGRSGLESLVEELRAMPPAEREKAIEQRIPKFQQKRVRKLLEKS